VNGSFFHGLVNCRKDRGKEFLGFFHPSIVDRLSDFLDLGPESGLVLFVHGVPAKAASVLPDG
jgi:hypothetical protein